MNIQLYFLRVRNAYRHVYRFFERRWKRNALWTFLLATFFVLGMWVSAAWASEAPSGRASDREPTQVLSATSRLQRDRSDWVSATSTSTTTTTVPYKKPADNIKSPPATSTPTNVPQITASQSEIEAFIREQAPLHGLDVARMVRIGRCESGFITNNINYSYYAGGGNPTGVYQYLPETWTRISGRSGLGGDVFDGKQNVLVTMWAFQNGYAGEWACK